MREIVEPEDIGHFERLMDYSNLPVPARTMSKATKVSEGDFGDWEAIRSWAPQPRSYLSQG